MNGMKRLGVAFLIFLFTACEINETPLPEMNENLFSKRMENIFKLQPEDRFYIETDKPLYKPGETLWFKLWVRDGASLKESEKSEIAYVELVDPRGSVIKTLDLIAVGGSAKGDFKFEDSWAGGIYKLRAYTHWGENENNSFEKEITLQKAIIPRVKMKIDFKEKAYGPGDEVAFDFELEDLENQPIANKELLLNVSVAGQQIISTPRQTGVDGKAEIKFNLPQDLNSSDGLVNVILNHNSYNESISRSIPIVLNQIELEFFPEGGQLVYGFHGRMAIKATNEFGKAADIEASLYDNSGTKIVDFSSVHMGMGSFEWTPEKGKFYHIKINRPLGIDRKYKIPLSSEDQYGMKVKNLEGQGKKRLEIDLYSPSEGKLFLLSQIRGALKDSRTIGVVKGRNKVRIPTESWGAGVAQLTLLDPRGVEVAERLVFVNRDQKLNVEIETDQEKYSPREKVQMVVKVKDQYGNPATGDFSLRVVDDALLSFADDKQGEIYSRLLLEPDLKQKVEEPNHYFDEEKDSSLVHLDHLMMTSGWRRFEWKEINVENPQIGGSEGELAILKGFIFRCPKDSVIRIEKEDGTLLLEQKMQRYREEFELPHWDLQLDSVLVLRRGKIMHQFPVYNYRGTRLSCNHWESRKKPERKRKPKLKAEPGAVKALGARRGRADAAFNVGYAEGGAGGIGDLLGGLLGGKVVEEMHFEEAADDLALDQVQELRAEAIKGEARGKGLPQAPAARGVLKMLEAKENKAQREVAPLGNDANVAFAADIDKILKQVGGLKKGEMADVAFGAGFAPVERIQLPRRQSRFYRARVFPKIEYRDRAIAPARTDFRTTLFWEPNLALDKKGMALVEFYNSDQISSFKSIVAGVSTEGRVGRGEHKHFTQIPVTMEARLPKEVTGGDTLNLPIVFKNNTQKATEVSFEVVLPENLKALVKWPNKLSLNAKESKTLYLQTLVKMQNARGNLILAMGSELGEDQVVQEILSRVKGFPRSTSFSGANQESQFQLNLGRPLPGSMIASLQVFPTVLDDLLQGIESILREPYGCFEQTSMSSYPNALILKYLKTVDVKNQEAFARAEELLKKGYNRLVTFETKEKGYEWFGGAPGHEALTAYGLMQFKDMEEVGAPVDRKMFERTQKWLLDRRDGQGGFKTNPRALDSYGRASKEITNAFIVYALAESGFKNLINEAREVYENAKATQDPYLLSLALAIAIELENPGEEIQIEKLLLQAQQKEGNWKGKTHSITYSTGNSLEVETTALAIQALLKRNKRISEVRSGVQALIKMRQGNGGFGTTQATIQALRAFTEFAKKSKKPQLDGKLKLLVNGKEVKKLQWKAGEKEEIRLTGLEEYLIQGNEKIEVLFGSEKEALPFTINVEYFTDLPGDAENSPLRFTQKLLETKLKVGETVRLETVLENQKNQGQPMTMMVLGIPAGLSAQPWQLKELQEKKVFDFYEIKSNQLALYWRQMKPEQTLKVNLDLKAEIPGTYAGAASRAYLYYTPETTRWVEGLNVEVNP